MNLSNFNSEYFLDKNTIRDFECPICFSIMFKVCELDRCGHLYCEDCIKQMKDCSICKNKDTFYHTSKYLQRKLYNMEVKCLVPDCDKIFTLTEAVNHLLKYHTESSDIDKDYKVDNNINHAINTNKYNDPNYNSENNLIDLNLNSNINNKINNDNDIKYISKNNYPFFQFKVNNNIRPFINIFRWLENVSNEITIKICNTYMIITSVTDDRESITVIKFRKDEFIDFISANNIIIGIKVSDLMEVFNLVDDNDILKFEYTEDESRVLLITQTSIKNSLIIKYSINIIYGRHIYLRNPPMECITIVPIKYLEHYSHNIINFVCTSKGIRLLNYNNTIEISTNKDDLIMYKIVDGSDTISNYFGSIHLITSFAKINHQDKVKLFFKREYPLIANYNTVYGDVSIYIAHLSKQD